MGKTYSVYVKDDELAEEIDKLIESSEYHNQAHFFNSAVKEYIDFNKEQSSDFV